MPESTAATNDIDLINYLKSIPDARMRRCIRFPIWYLLMFAVRDIMGLPDPSVFGTARCQLGMLAAN